MTGRPQRRPTCPCPVAPVRRRAPPRRACRGSQSGARPRLPDLRRAAVSRMRAVLRGALQPPALERAGRVPARTGALGVVLRRTTPARRAIAAVLLVGAHGLDDLRQGDSAEGWASMVGSESGGGWTVCMEAARAGAARFTEKEYPRVLVRVETMPPAPALPCPPEPCLRFPAEL